MFPASGRASCRHCEAPLTAAERARDAEFCCLGCQAVFELLGAEGLGRYYELGGGRGTAVVTWGKAHDHKWLEQLCARDATGNGARAIDLDVQGIHCAACVWLFEQIFRREKGGIGIVVNPALGRLALTVERDFDLGHFVESIERFGYVLGPARKEGPRTGSDLLLRTGACIAIAMNAMIFAIAIYAGLKSGPIFRFFTALDFALATLSVLIGGTVFFRSAWQALKQRVLHLDVPIALGIVLAYTGSALAFFTASGEAAYFDTITVFIALMLVGRFLQERVLERNRRQLLASDGADALLTRVVRAGAPELVTCATVRTGDRLLVAPGDLIPVPARLEDEAASVSLDWINGESTPREAKFGDELPAGAFNVGRRAIFATATSDFAGSSIVSLLRTTRAREADSARSTAWWRRFTGIYVVTVLAVAVGAFATWMIATRDLARALEVTTAVLVVTCPCAFGIATPMAYELVQAGLRRAGVFVRSPSFLDRAVSVQRIVFDKTGTLTTGALRVASSASLASLDRETLQIVYNLAARSTHPKSVAIAQAALARGARLEGDFVVSEQTGLGLETTRGGVEYRLGSAGFAGVGDEHGVVFSRAQGGQRQVLAEIELCESLRSGAADEVKALRRAGYDVWILSGDSRLRVEDLADVIGIDRAHAVAERSPEGKADWLATHDRDDTLMVGDGINDGPAAERAFASATPAIDRPFMPARTDFYFTSAGLRPVRLALASARALMRVTRRNLSVAVAYNVLTVGLAYAGLMTPLLCAIVMPVSSLSIVIATLVSLSPRSPLWRS